MAIRLALHSSVWLTERVRVMIEVPGRSQRERPAEGTGCLQGIGQNTLHVKESNIFDRDVSISKDASRHTDTVGQYACRSFFLS
jgi:hypothetical protein